MRGSTRTAVAMWVAFAVALLAAVVGVAATRGGEPIAAVETTTTTTSTTSTTSTTTTTTYPDFDPHTTTVATSAAAMLVVHNTPTDPVDDLEIVGNDPVRLAASFAPYSAERSDAPEIPSIEGPVQGRRRTATGWEFDSPTPWGNPATFVVTQQRGDWLRVQLPVRPNGTQGWIQRSDVTLTTHQFKVEIDLSDRTLRALSGTDVIAETAVVVGKSSTPTPTGRYYVTDVDERYSGSSYGPWVLPLSGFSQSLDWFADGVPVIAMHGTNRPELVGQAQSNGCVRMPDEVITELRNQLPLGTPVDINP